jgi:uncharacterized protein
MDTPNLQRARLYAVQRLERELPSVLTYHSLAHTLEGVVPAVERLAALEGVNGEHLPLLRTAAYYHDLGFVERSDGHEAISARLAAEVLPRFGYSPAQIEVIRGIILATRYPFEPRTRLESIMVDADLDVLGRDDFWPRNHALRIEREALAGQRSTDEEWYGGQLAFMHAHCYFTASAQSLRQAHKQRHVDEMVRLLDKARAGVDRDCVPTPIRGRIGPVHNLLSSL